MTLYALALTTGLRPEELYGLRWKDVALDRRRLTVNQVIAQSRRKKGEAGERFQFGPPKNDLSGRTIDFAPFIQKTTSKIWKDWPALIGWTMN